MNTFARWLGLCALALATSWSSAQDSGTIRVVLPFGPGSGTDNVARPLFEEVARELNQTAVIDNRPGANGFLAAEFVARAPADGKTLLFTSNTTHAINPVLFKKLPYDPVKDFKPIAMVLTAPYVLIVRKDMPVRNVNELAVWIKANCDKAA